MTRRASLDPLLTELAPPARMAVSYAPAAARDVWIGLLLLDRRLEEAALGIREPIVAQIKLAWWRERFASPAAQWPAGEPLLARLAGWDGEREALAGLVDGWEGLVGGEPSQAEIAALIDARGGAMSALARLLGASGQAAQAHVVGCAWAADDLAGRLGLKSASSEAMGHLRPFSRPLRPLAVLAEVARPGGGGLLRLGRVMRLGLLGR